MEVIRKLKSVQGEYKNFLAEKYQIYFEFRFCGTYSKGSSRDFIEVSERDFNIKTDFIQTRALRW